MTHVPPPDLAPDATPQPKPQRSVWRLLAGLVLGLLVAGYPFAVFFGLQQLDGRVLAGCLLVLFSLRLLWIKWTGLPSPTQLPLLVTASVICGLVLIGGNPRYLLYYPVAINMTLFLLFASTLRSGPSFIERIAQLAEGPLPPEAIPYCRKVTYVWCGFFLMNGGIALGLAIWGSLETWTLFTGLISYIMVGTLFAAEFAVRTWFKRQLNRRTPVPDSEV